MLFKAWPRWPVNECERLQTIKQQSMESDTGSNYFWVSLPERKRISALETCFETLQEADPANNVGVLPSERRDHPLNMFQRGMVTLKKADECFHAVQRMRQVAIFWLVLEQGSFLGACAEG
jgi:hypothetical protein